MNLGQLKKLNTIKYSYDSSTQELIDILIQEELKKEKRKKILKLNLDMILNLGKINGIKIKKINSMYLLKYESFLIVFNSDTFKNELLTEFEHSKIFSLYKAFFLERKKSYLKELFNFLSYRKNLDYYDNSTYYVYKDIIVITEDNTITFLCSIKGEYLYSTRIERNAENVINYKLYMCSRGDSYGYGTYDHIVNSRGYYQILLNEDELIISFLYNMNLQTIKDLDRITTLTINSKGCFINNKKNKVNKDLLFKAFKENLVYYSKKNNQLYNFYLFRKEQNEMIRYTIEKEIIFEDIIANEFNNYHAKSIYSYYDCKSKKRYLFEGIGLFPFKEFDYSNLNMDKDTLESLVRKNHDNLVFDYFNNIFLCKYGDELKDLNNLTVYKNYNNEELKNDYLLQSKLLRIKIEEIKRKTGR